MPPLYYFHQIHQIHQNEKNKRREERFNKAGLFQFVKFRLDFTDLWLQTLHAKDILSVYASAARRIALAYVHYGKRSHIEKERGN